MSRVSNLSPLALFVAGIAAGALSGIRLQRQSGDSAQLKKSLDDIEARLSTRQAAMAARLHTLEARVEEHANRFADVPSTTQIITAMEQLLSKTMASLDERLGTQAHSIEVLKTTVSQTDSLLERVLESLDTLQAYSDPSQVSEDTLPQRPV